MATQKTLFDIVQPSTTKPIVHACKVPLDKESVCERAVKKFQDMKRRKK